jgi:hypothetical protein
MAVFAVLLAAGLGLLLVAARNYDRSGAATHDVVVPGVLGVILVAGALGYLKLARRLVRESEA